MQGFRAGYLFHPYSVERMMKETNDTRNKQKVKTEFDDHYKEL